MLLNAKRLKIVFWLFFILFLNTSVFAEQKDTAGLGIIIGDPTGPSFKYWLDKTRAVDIGIGFQKDTVVYADYLWHGWDFFPPPKEGKTAGYVGLGLRFEEKKKDDKFGIRFVGGIAYWLNTYPIELFFELVPVFQITPKTDTEFDIGFGLRFYFI